ncbi:MAG: precorrin-6y C5,15-methyltransferase (decarboxylating) subunit CbiE [Planctomycetota bacterium]|jgi:precorrin-6y C5,15-methyltransferase (decarboxylating) CbiE subunit|nr:precorrin-6y C5,15-methyltransferase (decarboxylating) subunit CbiE [Planctomycetota bacterium]
MAMMHPIHVVGCGPGAGEFLTREAERVAAAADVLAGAARLLDLFPDAGGKKYVWRSGADDFIAAVRDFRENGKRVAVLVSGDVGVYSLASRIVAAFGADTCRLHPGVSAFVLAFARLGLPWENALFIHAHGGRPEVGQADIDRAERIAVALGPGEGWDWFVRFAADVMKTHDVSLCLDLSLAGERIVAVRSAGDLAALTPPRLAIAVLVRTGHQSLPRRSICPSGNESNRNA